MGEKRRTRSKARDDLAGVPDDFWETCGDVSFAIDRATFGVFDIFPVSGDLRLVQAQ